MRYSEEQRGEIRRSEDVSKDTQDEIAALLAADPGRKATIPSAFAGDRINDSSESRFGRS